MIAVASLVSVFQNLMLLLALGSYCYIDIVQCNDLNCLYTATLLINLLINLDAELITTEESFYYSLNILLNEVPTHAKKTHNPISARNSILRIYGWL